MDRKSAVGRTRKTRLRPWEFWNRIMVVVGTLATVGGFLVAIYAFVNPADLTTKLTGLLERLVVTSEEGKRETSDDPRKELANMGNPYTTDGIRDAIFRGDELAVDLYLKAGFDWTTLADEGYLPEFLNAVRSEGVLDRLLSDSTRRNSVTCDWIAREMQDFKRDGSCFAPALRDWAKLVVRLDAQSVAAQCGDNFRAKVERCRFEAVYLDPMDKSALDDLLSALGPQ